MGQIKRGISLARDLRRVGIAERGLVLDVGAHFGESIRFFRRVLRPSQVHAFEPIENNVRRLRRRWRLSNSVVLNQVAVSDLDSEVLFIGSGGDDSGRLLTPERENKANTSSRQPIKTIKIDSYLTQHELGPISLLKIDTEGHDLRVLEGARDALSQREIQAVIVEASMSEENQFHVPFNDFSLFFKNLGKWNLIGFYEQFSESHSIALRRANLLWVQTT